MYFHEVFPEMEAVVAMVVVATVTVMLMAMEVSLSEVRAFEWMLLKCSLLSCLCILNEEIAL